MLGHVCGTLTLLAFTMGDKRTMTAVCEVEVVFGMHLFCFEVVYYTP